VERKNKIFTECQQAAGWVANGRVRGESPPKLLAAAAALAG
jgi:hypothetical protein